MECNNNDWRQLESGLLGYLFCWISPIHQLTFRRLCVRFSQIHINKERQLIEIIKATKKRTIVIQTSIRPKVYRLIAIVAKEMQVKIAVNNPSYLMYELDFSEVFYFGRRMTLSNCSTNVECKFALYSDNNEFASHHPEIMLYNAMTGETGILVTKHHCNNFTQDVLLIKYEYYHL